MRTLGITCLRGPKTDTVCSAAKSTLLVQGLLDGQLGTRAEERV